MITEYEMSQATIENISTKLRPYESAKRSPSWRKCIHFFEGACGEFRDPVDWQSLPKGKHLRIVYLVDKLGPVIRWLLPGTPDVIGLLGGDLHDHLERGDGDGRARSGWLTVLEKKVEVSP